MRNLVKTVSDLANTPQGRSILMTLSAIPEQVMYKNLYDQVWHVSDRCPALARPFEHVRFSLRSMQLRERHCTSCGSHRALELGQALTVCGDALDVFAEPLDWPGISARRRFALDPLRSFPVRRTPSAASWAATLDLVGPWIADELAAADLAASSLDPDPLVRALCASSLVDQNDTASMNPHWLSLTELAAPHIRRDGHRRLRPDLRRRIDLCLTHPPRRYLIVAKQFYEFADGSNIERAVDLLTIHSRLATSAATVVLPPVAALAINDSPSAAIAELEETDDLDRIRWAVEIFHTAPDRSLASALTTARRLLRPRLAPAPKVRSTDQR